MWKYKTSVFMQAMILCSECPVSSQHNWLYLRRAVRVAVSMYWPRLTRTAVTSTACGCHLFPGEKCGKNRARVKTSPSLHVRPPIGRLLLRIQFKTSLMSYTHLVLDGTQQKKKIMTHMHKTQLHLTSYF